MQGYIPILLLAYNTHKVHKLVDTPLALVKVEGERKVLATRVHHSNHQLHNWVCILLHQVYLQ